MTRTEIIEQLACMDHLETQDQRVEEDPAYTRKKTILTELNKDLLLSRDIADLCLRASHLLDQISKLAKEPQALDIFSQQATNLSLRFKYLANRAPSTDPTKLVDLWASEKKSSRQIATLLNEHGFTTKYGMAWSHANVIHCFGDILESHRNVNVVPLKDRAKELRLRGLTLHQIADQLNQEGYKTPRDTELTYAKVFHLLKVDGKITT